MNFRYKLIQFMNGRYGIDGMFYVLVLSACVLSFINCFIFFFPLRIIFQIIVYALMFYAFFRVISKNIETRTKENRIIMQFVNRIKKHIDIKRQRRADTTHVYRKCPSCKAILRLPRRPGKHTTVCPKCNKQFKVNVRK